MNKTEQDSFSIPTPYEFGQKAFKKGLKRIPAKDKEFSETHLAGKQVGKGILPLNEWLNGWDKENLA